MPQRFQSLILILTTFLLTNSKALAQQLPEPVVETRIQGDKARSLTGRWISIGQHNPQPIQAWAGIVVDDTNGPAAFIVQRRHSAWLKRFERESVASLPTDTTDVRSELASRLRHCQYVPPKFFDGVLLRFKEADGSSRFVFSIDYDIDGSIVDESHFAVVAPSAAPEFPPDPHRWWTSKTKSGSQSIWIITHVPMPAAKTKNVPSAATQNHVISGQQPSSQKLRQLVERLHELDQTATRKQHLSAVLSAADEIIQFIDSTPGPHKGILVDALYRKGRALGYMELPDVLKVTPVDDPVAHQRRFEANFQRLNGLVDTKLPAYILLRIRRERRRHQRGTALDLVEHYRRNHPDPVWHYKKRFDLLRELGAELPAHQAAARLWLYASMPKRPDPRTF